MLAKGQGPILIAGQTASGKSGLALELAQEHDGVIINADSMQVYRELQILTARPRLDEMQDIPHRLYGYITADTPYSVSQWLQDVESELVHIQKSGKRAIIVGGTGLYFKALLEGLSPVPEITASIRRKWRRQAMGLKRESELQDELLAGEPLLDLHTELQKRDPEMAARLEPNDRQRLARALEVLESTGKSLLYWQRQKGKPLIEPEKTVRLALQIDRRELYDRCNRRFDLMLERGALEEAKEMRALNLSPALPAMRAIGLRPLLAHLDGEISLDEAAELAKTETRQYAKRQNTWLKGNMITWNAVSL